MKEIKKQKKRGKNETKQENCNKFWIHRSNKPVSFDLALRDRS
jgi:hypothetical protein